MDCNNALEANIKDSIILLTPPGDRNLLLQVPIAMVERTYCMWTSLLMTSVPHFQASGHKKKEKSFKTPGGYNVFIYLFLHLNHMTFQATYFFSDFLFPYLPWFGPETHMLVRRYQCSLSANVSKWLHQCMFNAFEALY